jgi:hypothetical protein
MRIVVSLAWVCHFERCSRPSAARKCSEQKSTVESDATVQCLGGSVYACLIASKVVSDVAVVVSALSSCVCERGWDAGAGRGSAQGSGYFESGVGRLRRADRGVEA